MSTSHCLPIISSQNYGPAEDDWQGLENAVEGKAVGVFLGSSDEGKATDRLTD